MDICVLDRSVKITCLAIEPDSSGGLQTSVPSLGFQVSDIAQVIRKGQVQIIHYENMHVHRLRANQGSR